MTDEAGSMQLYLLYVCLAFMYMQVYMTLFFFSVHQQDLFSHSLKL